MKKLKERYECGHRLRGSQLLLWDRAIELASIDSFPTIE
jgi:hypothetical protein